MNYLKAKYLGVVIMIFVTSLKAQVDIIPQPMEINIGENVFTLNYKTAIIASGKTDNSVKFLSAFLEKGFYRKPKHKKKGNGIELVLSANLKAELGKEGYHLKTTSNNVKIEAATETGLFYGIQSFRQLLPSDFETQIYSNKSLEIPGVELKDKPRFSWRAFMLDESRHFKGVAAVKDLLDQMALLKMNVFHWHLTDDQGWRIEIKKYPKLTEIGSHRLDTQSSRKSPERVGAPHEGFYTQEQIKDIIQYAQERHIQIIPEIEMPGHATAAIASYPWLGVLGTTKDVSVTFGKLDDSFNISDDKVYEFLTDVLSEVFELFPSKIVHIGGDEVRFGTWENSKEIQNKIKKEGLKSPADLQIFFTNQISNFVESHGHRMMGWNEVLGDQVHEWDEGSNMNVNEKLSETAIIHFWKGSLDLIKKAVINGHDVVNSLHSMTYLDYDYKSLRLSKAYSFDPIPEGLEEEYHDKILGLGCQMWSEWIPEVKQMENQVYPRIAAYAEVGWTMKSNKNYENFIQALVKLEKRWELSGINYHEGFD
ncbi:beta-N-acetylhexosaminidase [Gelidibacter salicanalis]|uniref:beta-N-acetylhexosaminidase n=1 Tax=Gelidibacter salicanalis TaxID=291193 RepID=A0A934KQK0_9FLAO|nr:beta-N-acetylhexosaminidase [Gelidibacter salicanalis]MBJ7881664.1 beta-N-acetylhexosaminidase [Gelidibacter salicanalis]